VHRARGSRGCSNAVDQLRQGLVAYRATQVWRRNTCHICRARFARRR
jgi:hypothetical protein